MRLLSLSHGRSPSAGWGCLCPAGSRLQPGDVVCTPRSPMAAALCSGLLLGVGAEGGLEGVPATHPCSSLGPPRPAASLLVGRDGSGPGATG